MSPINEPPGNGPSGNGPPEDRSPAQGEGLAERLGYDAQAKLLILTSDDLGLCHAANVGVYQSLRNGLASSASLMVPCPWSRSAAAAYRGEDIGVHLTLNAELELYRWGPITQAPSLLDGDGGFPRTLADLWDHADLDEVRRECRAQIERAILWGFDVSHLGAHLGALELRPEFFDVYVELALEFRLPIRLSGAQTEPLAGFPFRTLAAGEGVVFPDDLLVPPAVAAGKALIDGIERLRPGVTEAYLHPAVAGPELMALTPDWESRADDHEMLSADGPLSDALDGAGVTLIGYRHLREVMRRS